MTFVVVGVIIILVHKILNRSIVFKRDVSSKLEILVTGSLENCRMGRNRYKQKYFLLLKSECVTTESYF